MTTRGLKRTAWVAVLGLAAVWPPGRAAAQEAAPAPPAPIEAATPAASAADEDIKALRDQIEALDQKVKVLERQKEIEKEETATKAKTTPVITWKDGFTIKTPDDKYSLQVGGWLAYDWAWFKQDDDLKYAFGDEQDGTGFRSARIRLRGTVTKFIEWQAEYEFAGENGQDTPAFFDTYIQFNDIPYAPGGVKGRLRLGHFREPFSLEENTRQPSRTFLERSLASVFYPSRNMGVMWSDSLFGEEGKERFHYALGVFKTTDNWPSSNDGDEDGGYNLTARVTGLPWYAYGGRRLLHLGFGYSHRSPNGAVLGWNVRPETRLSLFRYVNADQATNNIPPFQNYRLRDARADDVNLFNWETALVTGPFSLQGEYTLAKVATTFGGERNFNGYYVQASGFLTGEHRPYRHENATFDRVRPKKNFGWGEDRGPGAWEVGLRWSHADLDDGPVRGGVQDSLTAGVNWYLNPQTRITMNYIRNWVENDIVEGAFDVFETRFHVDF